MPVVEDVLQINLIFVDVSLIATSDAVAAFRADVGTELTSVEAAMGSDVVQRTHTVNRDRISIVALSDRSIIAKEYPTQQDFERFAQVASMAIAHTTGQQLRAFGYNIDLIYETNPKQPAIEYLGSRLFTPSLFQERGWQLVGGAARLIFQKNGQLGQVRLEPRLNDDTSTKVYMSLNFHQSRDDGLPFPTEADIRTSLDLLWTEAYSLVAQLNGE